MITKLIIVESPGKIKKIQGFLGSGYKVMASVGHVRDLPLKELGVTSPHYIPRYQPTERGHKVLQDLKKAVQKADEVYLATDPDREGEAIAWHLADALKLVHPKRISFTEITETAVKKALASPRGIDMDLVKAQEARRVLDRLVGYPVSQALSQKLNQKLSAGRVQSPALKLVVEREQAINSFEPVKHYGVELTFEELEHVKTGWKAHWAADNWLAGGEKYFRDEAMASKIAAIQTLTVAKYEETESRTAPPAPFTTSTLQQEASGKLKFGPKQTMELAQKLYEQGAISYMRTDSLNLSMEAVAEIRKMALKLDWPLPDKPRVWQSKAGAQEAHEAIRPTHLEQETAGTTKDEQALYQLIHKRTIASQLSDAVYAVASAELTAEQDGKAVLFKAQGRRLIEPGWRVLFPSGDVSDDEEIHNQLPRLEQGRQVRAVSGRVVSLVTKPPSRFTEASLISQLERLGIGRPSTYAAILENLKFRKYVELENRQLEPTDLGVSVIKALSGNFSFMDLDFTKTMETRLDDIAMGKAGYLGVVSEFDTKLVQEIKDFSNGGTHV